MKLSKLEIEELFKSVTNEKPKSVREFGFVAELDQADTEDKLSRYLTNLGKVITYSIDINPYLVLSVSSLTGVPADSEVLTSDTGAEGVIVSFVDLGSSSGTVTVYVTDGDFDGSTTFTSTSANGDIDALTEKAPVASEPFDSDTLNYSGYVKSIVSGTGFTPMTILVERLQGGGATFGDSREILTFGESEAVAVLLAGSSATLQMNTSAVRRTYFYGSITVSYVPTDDSGVQTTVDFATTNSDIDSRVVAQRFPADSDRGNNFQSDDILVSSYRYKVTSGDKTKSIPQYVQLVGYLITY